MMASAQSYQTALLNRPKVQPNKITKYSMTEVSF